MTLNSNKLPAGGSSIAPLDPGTYPTRLVCVADLGLQAIPAFQGKEKPPANMVAFTYEFVDEFLQDENGEDIPDKPRWITEMMSIYHLSSEKAKSTARYNALDPSHTYEGDFSKLINTPCMVTVVHNPGKNGKVYTNIAGVTPMREKDANKCPELVNEAIVFDLDEPSLELYNQLPGFVQDKIKGGLEHEGSKLYDMLGDAEEAVEEAPNDDLDGDENPY